MVLWKLRFWLIYEKIKLLLTSLIIRVTSLAPPLLGGVKDIYFFILLNMSWNNFGELFFL